MTGNLFDDLEPGPELGRTPYQDNDPGFQRGSETSEAAAMAKKKDLARSQARVLQTLIYGFRRGEATADEIADSLGLLHNSVAPRMTELKKLGFLEFTGEKRLTRSGQMAAVLKINQKGIIAFSDYQAKEIVENGRGS